MELSSPFTFRSNMCLQANIMEDSIRALMIFRLREKIMIDDFPILFFRNMSDRMAWQIMEDLGYIV